MSQEQKHGVKADPANTSSELSPKTQTPILPLKHDGKASTLLSTLLTLTGIIGIALVGWGTVIILNYHKHPSKISTTPSTISVATPAHTAETAVTNVWTGGAHTYNWNEAANWSLGVPTNGQNVEIDVSKVTQPSDRYGKTAFAFQNDIPNLIINRLLIDGEVDGIIASITGNPFTITRGISDSIIQTNENGAAPQITLNNLVQFAGNATVNTSWRNVLTFGKNDTAINLADKTIQFAASDISQISISGAIVGTGTIQVAANAVGQGANVMFRTSSPDFVGKVIIGSGDIVHVGNQMSAGGSGPVDAFGHSSIDIMNGGALSVFATGTTTFALDNNITMNGNGVAVQTSNTGGYTGALSACIAQAEEGCDSGVHVTLTGTITLTGNTELGASYGGELGGTPPGTTVTYTVANPITGTFSLAAVPNSQVAIQRK